ncbi:hypothetical protein GCM10007857_67950 [Bradyrhizobium iriomotense]|uniref:Uncharacterized protein n=1 Tax=Bradyrhizobium iriomotense TaxID=441950 RepID=A0ABQ6BBR0_9BRAD|nr:hypothetical protein GCM10007857_67950 [Bradyrhizobium iriomotense]
MGPSSDLISYKLMDPICVLLILVNRALLSFAGPKREAARRERYVDLK